MIAHERIRQAARDGLRNWCNEHNYNYMETRDGKCADAIADEICWQLRQRPIQLTRKQYGELFDIHRKASMDGLVDEIQRRYLFSEEPEVPVKVENVDGAFTALDSTTGLIATDKDRDVALIKLGKLIARQSDFERGQHAKEGREYGAD